ncbi:diacylglycerol/lipid kinase family protein [Microvirga pudoricolor]|uniref:diacylglycerol/lipid kinase family protein n=1 Tax=Microvirga pudoricolor TaxID=2778729 RepID=UPI00194DE41A|nr:YegS/Rv2252/BmrU family lipid kinase [Microvirga pudoricolor]MBM6592854.1 YegS/Rv2252/BmrU family lipid kinase [Microvirga pudoricolor]
MKSSEALQEAVLVVNTQSRWGQRYYDMAKREIERQGIRLTEAYPVRDAARIVGIVEEAIGRGHRFIVVGGGDGTVSSVVSLLAGRDIVLGILPMGTANNFARANGIPLGLEGAARVLAQGAVARVDLGRINQECFTNAVSIGVTSAIHRSSSDAMKRHLGRSGYLMVALSRLRSYRAFACRLVLDGKPVCLETLDLRIANGPYHGGLVALPEARMDSGRLVVRAIKGASPWVLGRMWMQIALGRTRDPDLLDVFEAREIEIATEPEQFVSVDGEALTRTPVRIGVLPAALRLKVPKA